MQIHRAAHRELLGAGTGGWGCWEPEDRGLKKTMANHYTPPDIQQPTANKIYDDLLFCHHRVE
jgi:hypothetical protein